MMHNTSWRGAMMGLSLCFLLVLAAVIVTATPAKAAGPLMIEAHSCVDSPNHENCNNQDPVRTRCDHDAQTVRSQPAWHNGVQVGYVDLRQSPTCQGYWVRGIGYAHSGIMTIHAVIQTASDQPSLPGTRDIANNSLAQPDGSVQAYTDMSYQQQQPPTMTYVVFDFTDGTSLTVQI
ncbi:hypothetical protein KSF_108180 [Reticulibacter mediterranei]|uniref:DUF2690 domain-containing protein n=1 Tax=Reticulibacter mediterranei TaxID=2778369 RepID=A0A8J3J1V1_9CHLR|nr:hypothetical protein [Reticulibacter mediterranei]GHP00771.1 hypothetical protein KSF_108180 [Reticulibacter mediterranei]